MEDSITIQKPRAENTSLTNRHAAALLELFYPVQYRSNMAVEDTMRGDLSRKQAAILWLIHVGGNDDGCSMRRKDIVLRLQDWFGISSPAITQALRRMARPPTALVRLVEDADSAREKRIILTPKGEDFIRTMVGRGRGFLGTLIRDIPEHQVRGGIQFLRSAVAAVEGLHSNGDDHDSVSQWQRTYPVK